jgi:hypothetical protein
MATKSSANSNWDKYRYTYWNMLVKIGSNHSSETVREKAKSLLSACNTAGGYDIMHSEVHTFLNSVRVPKKLTKPLIVW